MKCKRLTPQQAQDLLRVALGTEKPWSTMLRDDSIDVGASKLIRMDVHRDFNDTVRPEGIGESGGEMRWFLIGPVRDVRYWFELV